MKKHLKISVVGRVQGVWFRKSTKLEADRLGLKGLVRNQTDGSVYIEVEGEESSLDKFIEWCNKGPEKAIVEKVEVLDGLVQGFTSFNITYI